MLDKRATQAQVDGLVAISVADYLFGLLQKIDVYCDRNTTFLTTWLQAGGTRAQVALCSYVLRLNIDDFEGYVLEFEEFALAQLDAKDKKFLVQLQQWSVRMLKKSTLVNVDDIVILLSLTLMLSLGKLYWHDAYISAGNLLELVERLPEDVDKRNFLHVFKLRVKERWR